MTNLGLKQNNIRSRVAERIKKYSMTLWIANSILAETIENANTKIKSSLLKNNKNTFENYFRGVIAGDGNFFSYRDKKGSLHSKMDIYEEKEEYIKIHKKILDLYNLKGKIKKIKDKNLYVLTLIPNWDTLLKLLNHDVFLYAPHHKKRLIWAIQNHKRYRSLKYITNINNKFDVSIIKNISNMNYSFSSHWIKKREKENLVEFIKKEGRKQIWKLTNQGINIKNILKLLPNN